MREPLSSHPYRHRRPGAAKALIAGASVLAVAVLAAVGTYTFLRLRQAAPQAPVETAGTAAGEGEAAPAETRPAPAAGGAPAPEIPPLRETPDLAPEIPLPALDESDAEMRSALTELAGAAPVEAWLKPEQVIRNVVVTIDNLPRAALDQEQRPLEPAPGEFVTSGSEDAPVLDEANFDRYTSFVRRVAALDAEGLAALYVHYRPLFNEAYRDLGYPEGNFDVRLVEVIDHMLAAPVVEGPIRLTRPRVMYEYADESLERSSAGHKLMIRMGPENAAVIKDKLRELRAALTGRAEPGEAAG